MKWAAPVDLHHLQLPPDHPSPQKKNYENRRRLRNVAGPNVRKDGAEIPLFNILYHKVQLGLLGTTLPATHYHHRLLAPLTWLLILEEPVRKNAAAASD